jgi:Fur family transcriptional regulator, zinc uptake regulator
VVIPLKGSTKIVWNALCENGDKPVSAYGLLTLVREHGIRHAPTIYRALHKLEELGRVHRIVSLNSYIMCDPPHSGIVAVLICNQCHQVSLVRDQSLDSVLHQLSHAHLFRREGQIVELSGVCGNCQLEHVPGGSSIENGHSSSHSPCSKHGASNGTALRPHCR